MMKIKTGFRYLLVVVVVLVAFSCKKQRPQIPSNKEADTPQEQVVDLTQLNRDLVQKEDSLLSEYVVQKRLSFEKDAAGFWYEIENHTQNKQLQKDDICNISYELFLLDGSLVEEVENLKITAGKKELISGLDDALMLMRVGETAVFLFPWNLAYGMRGYKDLVPGYSSVIFRIQVKDLGL
ncbi:FKBP-type peptidyl-prolyl cis-trans isomerase [Paludibacter sp. 221]|uniref:FKBP-type peptidyl-prolyl cis-trans isomerase n=1 Tax=Paludibacter sp. 221 TaxID=2302939 RepID=UPI0013D0D28F|nr:FKBP-type peptidyl-prolyl cis-trans isomerase [Paludibacter sp. 221]